MNSGADKTDTAAATLRLVHVTDTYTLDSFPSLKTLLDEKREELKQMRGGEASRSKTKSVLTGDFLMPYLLSSLDQGKGMMTMCNETPIDILTWGNHENDLLHEHVMAREKEYTGTWINSNMQSHPSFAKSKCQKDCDVIEVASADGKNVRQVGLIAVVSNTHGLYRPGAFGGATIEDPYDTLALYKEKLERQGVDLIIPLEHLYEPQDEVTAERFDFPVILSGHDHHVVNRVHHGSRILKPGENARKAIILDITWANADPACEPTFAVEVVTVKDWPADPGLAQTIEMAYAPMESLRKTQLDVVPEKFRPLTSAGARGANVTMAAYLLSRIRDALNTDSVDTIPDHCDAVLIKGGNIRGGRDYADDEHLSLEALKSELTATQEICVVELPGSIIRGALRESWNGPNPGWMQYDDGVVVDEDGFVTHIGGQALDDDRLYRIGTMRDIFNPRDGPSIGHYFEANPDKVPDKDSGMPVHALLLSYLADRIWKQIWKALDRDGDGVVSAEELRRFDTNHDGVLNKKELVAAMRSVTHFSCYEGEDTLVDWLLNCAGDANHDGILTLEEINKMRAH